MGEAQAIFGEGDGSLWALLGTNMSLGFMLSTIESPENVFKQCRDIWFMF